MTSAPDPRSEPIVQESPPLKEGPVPSRPIEPDGGLKKTIVGTAIGRMLGSALEHAAKKAWAWLEKFWDWFTA